MRRLADDLERLRQQLGHTRWVFAGYSAGGTLACLYAVKYPDALQGLILAATAPSGQFRHDPDCIYNPERADWAQIQAARDRALAADATPDDVRRWAQIVLQVHQPHRVDDLHRPRRDREVKRWKNGKMVVRWMAAGLLDAEKRFPKVKGYRDMPMPRCTPQAPSRT